ncbi:MAG: T9SS type A sorting domain-containing protein [Ignavibacteria bacterium]|nr:T9SS type A sorting domain-containing protein [Ignavibacteria bacterium]
MKNFLNIIMLICASVFPLTAFAQNPTYTLDVNDQTPYPETYNSVEFDLDMTWTNSGSVSNFEYAGGQYFFDANIPAISNGGTLSYSLARNGSDTISDLPANLRPRNPQISGTQLRLAVNTFPGAGSGFNMPAGIPVKIIRMKLATTAPLFAYVPLNLVWRNGPTNPFTKIFAYVGTTNTDISTPNAHTISIPNYPLGTGIPYITANFYSSTRTASQFEPVNFLDSSYGSSPATSWQWSFPGGTPSSSTDRNPANIVYATPGTYDVSLSVWSGCCSDIETKTGYITVLPGCTPSWKQTIRIADNGNTIDSLKFGMAPAATNGLDTCLGEVAVPPPPPTGVFDCRFVLPTNDATKTDMRQEGNFDISWRMTFQPSLSGYPFTFIWDPATLPAYGTFYLKDEITGTIVNVNMRNQNSYVLNFSGLSSLKIEYYYSRTYTASVTSGWNIVSVPVRAQNMNYLSLFPGATSQAFTYSNGYIPITMLGNGAGYFMKFNSTADYQITGYSFQPENMNVVSGWNLIGPFDKNIPVSSIISSPSGIVNSFYFGYADRYLIADTLKSGKGYWVRTTGPGYLYKGSLDNSPNVVTAGPFERFTELRFRAGDESEAGLYLAKPADITNDYSMPPVPPQGIFDVRFGSDKFVEALGQNQSIRLNSAEGETKLAIHNTGGQRFRIKDGINGSLLDEVLTEGTEITIPAGLSSLVLESSGMIPMTYELSQNYPNPFNPVTTIKYQIPNDVVVKIVVYDVLGKEVKYLVNEFQPAGSYEVMLDAGSLSSGVYFYRMTAGGFEDLKKLIVLK